MGRSRQQHQQPETMIDHTSKQSNQQGGGDKEFRAVAKKSQAYVEAQKCQPRRKHDAINLPKNLVDSDSEEYERECSSDDENDQLSGDRYLFNEKLCCVSVDKLTCNVGNLALAERKNIMDEALKKLRAIAKEYQETGVQVESKNKELKARSPYRNRLTEHKQKPFDRPDMTVTTTHGNGGRVYVQIASPSNIPEPVANISKEHVLLDAIQDKAFLASFNELSSEEAERVFLSFVDQENQDLQIQDSIARPCTPNTEPPKTVLSYSQRVISPATSPDNLDLYDSSYETGSPCGTVVTSPGGPHSLLSPPISSIGSESDQELDSSIDSCLTRPLTNIVVVSETAENHSPELPIVKVSGVSQPKPLRPMAVRHERTVRPLGEVVNCVTTSASQRLYELSKSTSFCVKHFTIQLVRVVMTTKTEATVNKIEGFTKSLLSTMKTKLANKAHEGDIWQLSIYAHVQFLLAPDRVHEYCTALTVRDDRGHSLLYIAAVERCEKPLIARCIAESMAQVGYSPLELDENGNTLLHTLAKLGDSHIHVLSELLMASGANQKSLFDILLTNNAGQNVLHAAVLSPNPHLTTVLFLLKMGARPLDQDENKMTALHYHIKKTASHLPRLPEEVEVIRKMLQTPITLTKESLMTLDCLRSDPSIPSDISSVINTLCFKDLKLRKNEKR